jgi:hypothetical protein
MLVVDAASVLGDAVTDPLAEVLEIPLRVGDADHRDGQGASLHHRIEGGKDLLVGEVASRTEEHERIGRPRTVVGLAPQVPSVRSAATAPSASGKPRVFLAIKKQSLERTE